jgi:Na+/H+ antiporter NhaD/arsenite permease-like protein
MLDVLSSAPFTPTHPDADNSDIMPPWLAQHQHTLMWAIFALTYLGIAIGGFPKLVLDRTGIALVGAIAMLAVHGITLEQAARHVSYETMCLLFGLMIFSAQLRVAGFYVTTGRFLTRLTDRPRLLLAGLIGVSAILSAVLANDIVCLAFTPLLCEALLAARKDPIPYLVALATSSNIGSAATIIGNPQNMHIGAVANLPFGHFALVMLPPVLIGLALNYVGVLWIFGRRMRRDISTGAPPPEEVHSHQGETLIPSSLPLQTYPPQRDTWLIFKTLTILAGVVVLFLFARGEWRAIGALAGAALLLCSHNAKAAKLYQLVDWNLLLLFLGLFVVNGAMQNLVGGAFAKLRATGVNLHEPVTLSAVTLGLSNVVSNVPAVLLLQNPIQTAPPADQRQLWYLLALVSTWAGNLTLVGSIANLIVAESAAAFGVKLDLATYCRLGIPLTITCVLIGTAWLLLVF